MKKNLLIFDVFGDFAHFRKYYATTSPVSFSIIPPVTVLGVLGAILGLSKKENEYIKILNEANTLVAVQILNPVKKMRMGVNLVNTKGNVWVPKQRREGARTQIRFEFLKNPSYRLYVGMDDEQLFKKLTKMVREHKSYFTVSLGLSELLGDFRYVDEKEFTWQENDNRFVDIASVVPIDRIVESGINILPEMRYLKEMIPLKMNHLREVMEYGELLSEIKGRFLNLKINGYWEHGEERVVLI